MNKSKPGRSEAGERWWSGHWQRCENTLTEEVVFPPWSNNKNQPCGDEFQLLERRGTFSFLSACLPEEIALHRPQGCQPSNVLVTATLNKLARRFVASMLVHGTVCSTAQCPPGAATSAMTTNTLANFRNTQGRKRTTGNGQIQKCATNMLNGTLGMARGKLAATPRNVPG